ncbi:Hypothetical protein NTJ_06986 [Nesidiocoris tenuis]|nr:Hypothetical protein NTJ_06986 [Nesidiocoris tenuis]
MEVGVPGGTAPPFHQIKSLQELQNEVGALLEFREVVMEAFPQLKAKLRGGGGGGGNRWEPGVRVRRKQPSHQGGGNGSKESAVGLSASSAAAEPPRSRSNSRSKSVGGSGGCGAPSTLIQDSGFSTADSSGTTGNSSKKNLLPPEDELWALLELIQAKGSRLRLEVECMKERCSLLGVSGRSRSLGELRVPSDIVLQEKEELCCRVQELERDNFEKASAAAALSRRVSELQEDKRRLEGELAEARGPHLLLARDRHKEPDVLQTPLVAGGDSPELYRNGQQVHTPSPSNSRSHSNHHYGNSGSSASPCPGSSAAGARRKLEQDFGRQTPSVLIARCDNQSSPSSTLGRLDGLVSSPAEVIPCPKGLTPDRHVTAAILKETNLLELQRHLITTTHHAQVVQAHLDKANKGKATIATLLEKAREENEDLKFQLEEKRIELEGTRARVRLLERGVGSAAGRCGAGSESSAQSEDNSSTESGRALTQSRLSSHQHTSNQHPSHQSNGSNQNQPTNRRPSRIPLKAPPNSLQQPSSAGKNASPPQPVSAQNDHQSNIKTTFWSNWLRKVP